MTTITLAQALGTQPSRVLRHLFLAETGGRT